MMRSSKSKTTLKAVVASVALLALLGSGLAVIGASQAASQLRTPAAEVLPPPLDLGGADQVDGFEPAVAALAVLDSLRVAGRAPNTGYDRAQFGPAWKDIDSNGCSTRFDILIRDLIDITIDEANCKVLTGTLNDPYTGTAIVADQPGEISDLIDIEHVVALGDAWVKGAQQLTAEQRLQFANDPVNLLAADSWSNAQKGSSDAATWLPSNKSFRCQYVTIQVNVKAKYGLWVTQAERDAIAGILSTCGNTPVDAPAPVLPAPDVPVAPAPVEAPPAATEPGSDVSYQNCTAVRAAGAAPISAGDPGYGKHLDRDGDGIGCE